MARTQQSAKRKRNDNPENIPEASTSKKRPGEGLITAARQGDFEIVKRLVEQGTDVDQKYGKPLKAAIKSGQLVIVQYLIEHGADIQRLATYGSIPALHLAVKEGHQAIAEHLLEQGADINELEPYDCGGTPLHVAVDNKDFSMMTFLLEQGADIQITHKDGWTPVCCAIFYGRLDIVTHLLKFTSDAIFKGKLVTVAAEYNRFEIMKYLIEQGADINYTPDSGAYDDSGRLRCENTPLIAAILTTSKGSSFALANFTIDEVKQLRGLVAHACRTLNHLNLETCNYKIASFSKHDVSNMQTALAERGDDLAKKLHAKLVYNLDMEKYLLAKGADVTKKGSYGRTALHYCVYRNCIEMAKLLIIYGALAEMQQPNITPLVELKEDGGISPLDIGNASSELIAQIKSWHNKRFFLANKWKMDQEPLSLFKSYTAPVLNNQLVDKEQVCEISFSI